MPVNPTDVPHPHHPHGHHHRRSSASRHATHDNPFVFTLSEKQQAALQAFKSVLEGKGAYVPPNEEGSKASVDDLMLVRFLKARRWEPQAAATQFFATLEWRKKHQVDTLYRDEVVPEEYESWKQTYPKFVGRRDRHGNPLYVYKLSVLTSGVLKELGKVPEEVRYRRIVALYELLHNLAFPLCLSVPIHPPLLPPGSLPHSSPEPPAPLAPHTIRLIQNTTIIDFSGTSLGSMFSFRHHLAQASTLAQANHPETLGSIFVFGAPGWWGTVWGWIKNWFDEQTRAKVHILPAGQRGVEELLRFVPRENLPKTYGGELAWEYEDDPVWDADIEWLLRRVGAPRDGGVDEEKGKDLRAEVSKLRGPVIVTPRTEQRPIKVELVGKGRKEVLLPAEAAMSPTSTTITDLEEIPVPPEAEGAGLLTAGGPATAAANVAPQATSSPSRGVDPADIALPLSVESTTTSLPNGTPVPLIQQIQETRQSNPQEDGHVPGPEETCTPGFVPNLAGGVLGTHEQEEGENARSVSDEKTVLEEEVSLDQEMEGNLEDVEGTATGKDGEDIHISSGKVQEVQV
ncbi:CRAL/TRIO domain-containing protein [Dacryopinax primogenitus]|uniref:CRAL/TRIO domain-containing protein n=1 Tax=Dacryopinax primogenitus (strain DJM 731) TaxID=1858805 RepID=M5FR94_DACPD|nr:CRAL/TRIO domain-containing protein [Dacryopinax primogenitus]EJT97439.1 CRAL/TRIO domain-containing protein [Dacryopinax primogenitus]